MIELSSDAITIAEMINGKLFGAGCKIKAVSIDSRENSEKPWCFFAIKGQNFNGADYAEEAVKNGAVLVIAQEKIETSTTVIYVENVVKALGLLAKKMKRSTKVIAVTGSNGKTTVKDMIISVLREKYSVCGTVENQNNEVGVPLTLLSVKDEDFCVIEMGMRGHGEIDWLSYISEPDSCVITNCGTAHIGRLGSKKQIFLAKVEILKHTKKYAFLPNEIRFKQLKSENVEKIYIDKKIKNTSTDFKNARIEFYASKNCTCRVDSIYEHDARNGLIAYKIGKSYGMSDVEICNGLQKYKKPKMRGEMLKIKGIEIISDCYNASYESVEGALKSLSKRCKAESKHFCVLLGDVLELGESAQKTHLKIGKLCKKYRVEKLFAYGKNSKYLILGYGNGTQLENFDLIAEDVFSNLNEKCILLIKASNGMNFNEIVEKMKEINNVERKDIFNNPDNNICNNLDSY